MSKIVDTAFVASFFANQAKEISRDEHDRFVRDGLAVACNTRSFALATAGLHQRGNSIPLAMVLTGEVISPEDSMFGEEYVLLDLAEVYVNETLFRVSCNGTLHEFTKLDEVRWTYQRTETQDWAGNRLEWIVDQMAPDHRDQLDQIVAARATGSVDRRRTPQTTAV